MKSSDMTNYFEKRFADAGSPLGAFSDFFAPRMLHDLGTEIFVQVMKELPLRVDDIRMGDNNHELIDLIGSDLGHEIFSSTITPQCWIAAIITESDINHAVNIFTDSGTEYILDGDIPITTLTEWIASHSFLRIEVYGRNCKWMLSKYFDVLPSTHAMQCYRVNKLMRYKNILVHKPVLMNLAICVLLLLVISLARFYIKKFVMDNPSSSSSSSKYPPTML